MPVFEFIPPRSKYLPTKSTTEAAPHALTTPSRDEVSGKIEDLKISSLTFFKNLTHIKPISRKPNTQPTFFFRHQKVFLIFLFGNLITQPHLTPPGI